ncbi:vitamin K epoxide reductase family protein [Gordonia sp. X0973]|uniref:vitamin K epoxide reductase family protein n=1 Tax=Gordonia sp. X0973 TaxID=2742602 RepID=UPI002657525E|nr:vitamin K epoxide reductase family protein [Gordonia sp. X0973]
MSEQEIETAEPTVEPGAIGVYYRERWNRITAWVLVIGGVIGFGAAFIITLDKLKILADPNYVPSCTIGQVLNCGTVMTSWQAGLFGFPNPLIGLAAFAMVVTAGVGIFAGARYANWYWAILQLGVTLALAFVFWLIYSSVYDIRKLCLYCMIVWAVTIAMFVVVTVRNIIASRAEPSPRLRAVAGFVPLIVIVAYMIVAGIILDQFWTLFF